MTEAQGSLMTWLMTEGILRDWLMAILVFVLTYIALKAVKKIILVKLKKLSQKTDTDLDDTFVEMLGNIRQPFYWIIPLYLAGFSAPIPAMVSRVIFVLFLVIVVYEAVQAIQKLTDYAICKYLDAREEGIDGIKSECNRNEGIIKAAGSIIKIILWVMAALVVMSNLGIDITSLIAGVGIGGIAVALAVQNILGDIFSSFSIYADKPFEVGDFIVIGADKGEVENIGIKSTRIRTPQGEQLIVSNKELTSARIQNFRKMERRRSVVTIGVTYNTSEENLKKIPEIIRKAVEDQAGTDFDRCHLSGFGASSVDFEMAFYVDSAEYSVYMDIQQDINLAIHKAFSDEKIEFAFPSQTIYLEKS